jgi:hypothetical protein
MEKAQRKSMIKEKEKEKPLPDLYVGFHQQMSALPRGSSVQQAIYELAMKRTRTIR